MVLLVLSNDLLWPIHGVDLCLRQGRAKGQVLHVARLENGPLPHRIRELASEGCAGKFLCDARQMVLGIGTLKAESHHKTRTLSVPGAARAFAVSKVTDDHVTSRTDREGRSFEHWVLHERVNDLFGLRRSFALVVEVYVHRQRLTVGPLPRATLTCSHPGLDGR